MAQPGTTVAPSDHPLFQAQRARQQNAFLLYVARRTKWLTAVDLRRFAEHLAALADERENAA